MALDNFQATTFPTPLTSACDLLLGDAAGFAVLASGTGAAPTTANVFEHGATYYRVDSGTGVAAQYQNTGSRAVPAWTLLDTALPGDTASSLIDTNSVVVVGLTTVASTVNGLLITGSATGAVSANGVLIAPGAASGSDAAISLNLQAKGVTGLITIGAVTQTGVITVGNATTATTAGVSILSGAGTASTQTIDIGAGTSATSGGKVVNIATGVPGTSTTNAVNIGSGGTTTGTVGVTIGSVGNAAHTTLIQGGSGAAITLTPQTTGIILIGASAGTGLITLGSSSTTQAVIISGGAGVATTTIAGGAAANITTIGGASSLTSLKGTVSTTTAVNKVTGGGSNNAVTGALLDSAGVAIATATGLRLQVNLGALTLQAGGNTLNLNATSAIAIKMHSAPATDIATAYAANSFIDLVFNGTSWLDMSQ